MKNEYYQPANNYERNLLMVKKFGGKLTLLLLPILLFMSMICSCYLTIISEKPFEYYLLKVTYSKLGVDLDFGSWDTILFMGNMLLSAFLIFTLLQIFFTSRNSDNESTPNFGLSLLHRFSQLELILLALIFVSMLVFTVTFIFGDPESFESFGERFGMSTSQLKAYKPSLVFVMITLDIIGVIAIWCVQSQTNFLKSVRMCLVDSVPKNKGAHTYGIFSMAIGICALCFAGFCTFMYYCYRDAFAGFGISLDDTYVYMSLILSYLKGLIPFLIGVNAFIFSSMVEEANTVGTLYNSYTVIGTASDPNLSGRMYR